MHELEELRQGAYENAKLYKEKTKLWHDKHILRREFKVGDLVLLFNSRLRLFAGKFKSKWTGPYQVQEVFPHGTIEIWSEKTRAFKVNGQRLKLYIAENQVGIGEHLSLAEAHPN